MPVVAITGCSSGFGLEAAIAFARNGDTVVATMRDTTRAADLQDRLQAEQLSADIRTLDVADSNSFDEFVSSVCNDHGRIDVLINNAGIHRAGAFEDLDEQAIRDVLEVNFTGPMLLARAVLPAMRTQGTGHIIMVSSLSGVAGLAGDVIYAGSKFAMEGATEALRHEVDRFGIKVSLVEAGLHKTSIMAHNQSGNDDLPAGYDDSSPYRSLISWQQKNLRQRMPDGFEPSAVAELLVHIAECDEDRLRWPADAVAERVLPKLFAQGDAERDAFLREVSGIDWWSKGSSPPEE